MRADGMRGRLAGATLVGLCGLVAVLIGTDIAQAGDRALRMHVQPLVRPGVAAMPLIADPLDDVERRINAALRRLDANVRRAVAECRTYNGRPGTWQRRVDATMRGPGYFSLVITDDSFCDGAHPNTDVMAIVYDLRSGAPVDWTRLLPESLTGTVALQQGGDGTKTVTLASTRLHELYLAGYKAPADVDDPAACREVVARQGAAAPPAMTAWLDVRQGGLAVRFGLANVVQACAVPVVIAAETLHREGARQLADAVDKASRPR